MYFDILKITDDLQTKQMYFLTYRDPYEVLGRGKFSFDKKDQIDEHLQGQTTGKRTAVVSK